MFLFELRTVTAGDDSADRELDPVLVLFGLIFRRRSSYRFAIRSGADPSDGKTARKNQHQEFARGVHHRNQYLSNGVTLEPCGSSWQPADQHVPCCRKLE